MTICTTLPTFEARIYVGLRVGYSADVIHPMENARIVCRQAVQDGWCVTITPTEFIYTATPSSDGREKVNGEPGVIIGVINYPRFPSDVPALKQRVLQLAEACLTALGQIRVTVVFTDETTTLHVSTGKSVEK